MCSGGGGSTQGFGGPQGDARRAAFAASQPPEPEWARAFGGSSGGGTPAPGTPGLPAPLPDEGAPMSGGVPDTRARGGDGSLINPPGGGGYRGRTVRAVRRSPSSTETDLLRKEQSGLRGGSGSGLKM